ncbi:hypothetical protein MKEN_00718300 [Mycena kentingensis (nom. inval.)]|nr:hypothetical protein MKEN_00718300 [Mycena kentingensis (nom. inval.)]
MPQQRPHSFNPRPRCNSDPVPTHPGAPLFSTKPPPRPFQRRRTSIRPTTSPRIRITTSPSPLPRIPRSLPLQLVAGHKARLKVLETTNEDLRQRNESYKTDIDLLNSTIAFYQPEYYRYRLQVRTLTARCEKDAERLAAQSKELAQLKKFLGLMIELGLHEPVLARAYGQVLDGKGSGDVETTLVEAIQNASARPDSMWSRILSRLQNPSLAPIPDLKSAIPSVAIVEEPSDGANAVDDLLQQLKNGDAPPASRRRRPLSNRTSALKSPAPRSPKPNRSPLKNRDTNRPSSRMSSQKSPIRKPLSTLNPNIKRRSENISTKAPPPPSKRHSSATVPFSAETALASLNDILGHFSSDSLGSLGSSTTATINASIVTEKGTPKSPIQIRVVHPTCVKEDGAKAKDAVQSLRTTKRLTGARVGVLRVSTPMARKSTPLGSAPSPATVKPTSKTTKLGSPFTLSAPVQSKPATRSRSRSGAGSVTPTASPLRAGGGQAQGLGLGLGLGRKVGTTAMGGWR